MPVEKKEQTREIVFLSGDLFEVTPRKKESHHTAATTENRKQEQKQNFWHFFFVSCLHFVCYCQSQAIRDVPSTRLQSSSPNSQVLQ